METESYSFLRKILGRNTYYGFKQEAKKYVPIATGIILFLFVLSLFIHWSFLSLILNLILGTSLIFILFVVCVIVLFDRGITIEAKYDYSHNYIPPTENPKGYGKTVVWGCVLILLGIAMIYVSNKYKKKYAFECDTFLVDTANSVYHIKDIDCEEASKAYNLSEMKGYEFKDNHYELCQECEEILEEIESEYESQRYDRL